MNTSISLLPF